MQRIGGFRRKTRHKLKKNFREKGKLSVSRFMKNFEIGETVHLKAEPGFQKGMYFPRFHGRTGRVVRKQGSCYLVQIKDLSKTKTVLIHPIHLK